VYVVLHIHVYTLHLDWNQCIIGFGYRASRAKLQRLEKETRELEKSIEGLRHYQAKCVELEKTNKKLQSQAHTDRREIIRLKEEIQGARTKISRLEKQQSELKDSHDGIDDIDGAGSKLNVSLVH